jgi:hypothetical protein
MRPPQEARGLRPLPGLIFASRWLQFSKQHGEQV